MNYILEYYDKIKSGEIVACEKLKAQMQILVDLLEECKSEKCIWGFDEELGDRPIFFIENFCRHSKGKWAGKHIQLELWQKAITQALYGFYNKETGFRKYDEALIVVARKNGKTTFAAGLALYGFLGDGEGGARVYCTANKLDQAKLLYNEAVNMLNQSPVLKKFCKKTRTTLVTKEEYGLFAEFAPLSADSTTLDGLNPSVNIYDEIHAAKTDELYSVIKQGTSARDEPMLIQITTNGFVREGMFDSQYRYASDYLNGVNPEVTNFLAFIYEQDSKEEINDETTWQKSNPNLGVSKDFEYLRKVLRDAKAKASEMTTVLTKDFNIATSSREGWLDLSFLKFKRTYDIEDLRGNYAIGGADLSQVLDLTCATIILKRKEDPEMLYVIQQCFMPQDSLEQKKLTDKIPYDTWVDKGYITLCEGNMVTYEYVTQWFKDICEKYEIIPYWLGYDRWSAGYWVNDMIKEGFRKMIPVIQGPKSFDLPMKYLKAAIEGDRINYNNNPILRWCLTNVIVKTDEGNNMGPDKKHASGRIDCAVSLLDAVAVMLQNKEDYINLQNL